MDVAFDTLPSSGVLVEKDRVHAVAVGVGSSAQRELDAAHTGGRGHVDTDDSRARQVFVLNPVGHDALGFAGVEGGRHEVASAARWLEEVIEG